MKRLILIPLILLLAVLLALFYRSQGRTSSGIIVTNADATVDHGVAPNAEINTLVSNVAEHIIIQFANANKDHSLPAINPELLNLVNQISSRIVIQFANANKVHILQSPQPELITLIGQISPRIVVQFANANKQHILGYPSDLIGDTTAPVASNVTIASYGSDGIRITWTTNEYATGIVGLGLAPGSYTQFVTDPNFNLQHEAIFTGLTSGDIVYIQITSTDRSGNSSAVTSEFEVPTISYIYLPLLMKK
jgi:hypothetical protein